MSEKRGQEISGKIAREGGRERGGKEGEERKGMNER